MDLKISKIKNRHQKFLLNKSTWKKSWFKSWRTLKRFLFNIFNTGQAEVLIFLEKQYKIGSEKEFTGREIAKALGTTLGSCTVSLKALRKHDEVEYHRNRSSSTGGNHPFLYKQKIER